MGPLVYVAIIAALFYLQLSSAASFASQIGHISLVGEVFRSPRRGEDRIKTLQILGSGITFPFSRSSPIRIRTKDGLLHKEKPENYRVLDEGFIVNMGEKISLFLRQDPDNPEVIRISLDAKHPDSIRSLSLPFFLMQGFTLKAAGGLPVVSIYGQFPEEVTVLSLPLGARVDLESHRIILTSREEGFGNIIVKKGNSDVADPYAYWLSQQGDILSRSEFDRLAADYLSRAREGWENSRFDRKTLTWETRGEGRGFNEEAAIALLTETKGTQAYPALLERMKFAAEQAGRELSLLSAPALGNIIVKADHTRRSIKLKRENILALIRRGGAEVFQYSDLYFLLTAGGTEAPLPSLKELAADLSMENLDPVIAAGAFAFYLACVEEEGEPWPEITRFSELPEAVLLPSIKVNREGFFITSNGGSHLLKLSLEVGRMLLQSGELLGRETHSLLGRELIHSVLIMGDEEGYLPREVYFEDGKVITTGDLPPEEVYPLLSERSGIARSVSLYRELGPGRWLYTNADEVEAQKSGRTERYLFSASVGRTHFVLLQGVRPGFRVRLLGVNWSSNRAFQNRHSGWFYDGTNRSLFVKLTQRREQEEVLITYPIAKPKRTAPPEKPADEPEEDGTEEGGQAGVQEKSADEPEGAGTEEDGQAGLEEKSADEPEGGGAGDEG